MNKLGTKLGAIAMSAVMALTFAPSAAITSLAAGSDGVAKTAADPGQAIYGLYNPNSGEHLFTANATEATGLKAAGWQEGDVKWYSPTSGTKVYRLYNANVKAPDGTPLGDHHYTTDVEEVAKLKKAGWSEDAEFFYAQTTPGEGSVPVYKLYNPNAYTQPKYSGAHHFTLDVDEKDKLLKAGWGEGDVAFYTLGKDKPVVEELSVSINNTTPKVGDTLTATVAPAGAKVTYSWSINGTVYATSESITVPASAKSGDRIKVVVTDADGETAEDMVFVGGFTIVSVEPTTANDGGDYKYIRATFSSALSSLDPSEIEIRRKSDKQLYSVESVRLSTDGKVADITLFGDKDAAGTDFLTAATIYVMTVTHDGFTDDLEFQLPDNRRDLIVTGVDVEAGTIDTVGDGRTSYPAGGQFTVGDAYLGNLGSLVGRNVVLGLNADNELMNFEVEDQNVVIAKVKYVIPNGATSYDKCYFETPEETKYYLVDPASATTTVAATKAFDAADGTILFDMTGDLGTQAGNLITINRLQTKDEYQYAKLVLNRNGRVATAMLQGKDAWSGHIIVTETDDTQVIESSDFALDFDGYTIVKDDEYIEVEDLEEGDICYYNSNDKFVDVYTEPIVGNIEKITSEKVTLEGEEYKWPGAQYLKSNKYATLAGTADTIESDLAYLYSLDEDADTTLVLNRKGEVQIIDGTVKDEAKTTSSVYVLTEDGAQYAIGKKEYIELVGSDGTQENLVIDISKVKSYGGKDSSLSTGGTTGATSGTSFYDKASDTVITTANTFHAKDPVKITKNEDGEVVGIYRAELVAHVGDATVGTPAQNQTVDADSTRLTTDTAANKITLKSSTPVYIINDSNNDGAAPFKVEKTTIGELTKTAKANKVTAYAKDTTTNAEYVIIDNTLNNAWTTTDTETIGGVIKSITKGMNKTSGKEEVETITLLTASGEVELDADELGYAGTTYKENAYAGFVVNKGTTTLAQEALTTDKFETAVTLDANRSYSDSKFVNQNATVTVSKAATAKVFVYDATEKSYTETTIGAVNTTKEQASLLYHIVDSNNSAAAVTSDVMVITWSGKKLPATITLDANALAKPLVNGTSATVVGTAAPVTDTNLTGITYTLEKKDGTAVATLTYDGGDLKVNTINTALTAGVEYRIKAVPTVTSTTTGTQFATVYSNVVKTAAVATYVGLTGAKDDDNAVAVTVAKGATTVTTTEATYVLDQYGNNMTTASNANTQISIALYDKNTTGTLTVANNDTLTLTWAGTGQATWTSSISGDDWRAAHTTPTTANTAYGKFGDCVITVNYAAS